MNIRHKDILDAQQSISYFVVWKQYSVILKSKEPNAAGNEHTFYFHVLLYMVHINDY